MKERTKAVIQKVLSDNIPKDIAKPKSRNKDNYPSGADRFFLTDPPFMEYQVDQYHKNMLKESKTKKIEVEKKKIVGSARKDEAARTVRKDAPESDVRKTRQEIVAENADMLEMLASTKEQGAEMKMDVLRSIKKEMRAEQKMQKETERRNGMGGRVRRKREKLVAKTSEKEEEEDEEQMSMQKAKKRKMEKVKVKKSLELDDIMDIEQE